MVELLQPAKEETAKWREIRRTREMLTEVSMWGAFSTGCSFVGTPLPVQVRPETIEHVKMILTADLLRLGDTP